MSALMNLYGRRKLAFVRGAGSTLYTEAGESYLDFGGGVAVTTFGHCDEGLVAVLCEQARTLWHVSNWYQIPQQEALAELLCAHSFADSVFFCNSGVEAMEAVVKLARRYYYERDGGAEGKQTKFEILSFSNCFHGRSLGMISASAEPKIIEGFSPLPGGFLQVELGDEEALESVFARADSQLAAVILEPLQGEGGLSPVSASYLRKLRALTDSHDVLLIFDEIQCGMGRCGRLFAYEELTQGRVAPDVVAVAKGLGGGFPVGAVLARRGLELPRGSHGTTFGGNPLAMAVAHAVIERILDPDFLPQVREKGRMLQEGLDALVRRHASIFCERRGLGLMQGLVCVGSNVPMLEALERQHMLVIPARDNVLRLLPALTTTEDDITSALTRLENAATSLKEAEN